jgi:L,D-transpeptidase ErfK/SrfK
MKLPSLRHSPYLSLIGLLFSSCLTAATYDLPSQEESLIGGAHHITAEFEDTFVHLGRHYNLGFEEIRIANPGVDPWLPGEGTPLVLPTLFILPNTPRKGIVVNTAEMRLYYYPKPKAGEKAVVITHPISIGRGDWQTPLATTQITTKVKNPIWYPPETIRKEHADRGNPLEKIVPSGPDNPLGSFALKLGLPSYLIHGTNRPSGIGMQVTHGCIRMYPEDIESLYLTATVGTPVTIINQPYKAGWFRDVLYFEAHPPLEQGEKTPEQPRDLTPLVRILVEAMKGREEGTLDWKQVTKLAANPSGIPIDVKFQQENWRSSVNRIALSSSD